MPTPLSKQLSENIACFEELMKNCNDVVKRPFYIGTYGQIKAYVAYVDVMVDRWSIEASLFQTALSANINLLKKDDFEYIKDKIFASADVKNITSMEEATLAVMSGDTAVFIEGFSMGMVMATRKFPTRGVNEPSNEVVIRGSREGFSEILRFNTVLIRRRIRDTGLKVKQQPIGVRSKMDSALMYIEDLVRPEILQDITERLSSFTIDGAMDSGVLEQLMETKWYSPFPQFQVTERPDKAASAILEGRVALILDNSPAVLLLPTTLNCFFQASDDYYNRWGIVNFTRILRYVAAFMAMALPGLYLAVTNFHPAMLPTPLVLSFAAAREGVPFPAAVEVIIMELAFELLREAGIRLPAPIGSTIGIVGGLIIGQAAVTANLVSPIIVIIVALTAISSFAIPNESFASAFRLIKYLIIILSATMGLYGFLLGLLIVLIHVSSLKSFDIPYMMPFSSHDVNGSNDERDSILRFPAFMLKNRPIFARDSEKLRLKK